MNFLESLASTEHTNGTGDPTPARPARLTPPFVRIDVPGLTSAEAAALAILLQRGLGNVNVLLTFHGGDIPAATKASLRAKLAAAQARVE